MNSQILLIDQNHSDLGETIARLGHVNRQTTFPAQLPTGAVLGCLTSQMWGLRVIWCSCAQLAVSFLLMFCREEEAEG